LKPPYKKLRPGNQGLREANRLAVLEARRRGATFAEAATAGKCSVQTARNVCKKAGFPVQKCERVPAGDVARALELHKAGWTVAAIAKEIGRSVGSTDGIIRHRVAYRGSKHNRKWAKLPESVRAAVLAARRKGLTLTATAKAAGCSLYSAWRACKEAGVRAVNGKGRCSGPGRRVGDEDAAGILGDAAAGLTAWEIAEGRGLQLAKVLEYLRRSPGR
jgi:lambda repressor-like predicted transcriptional regulator